MQSDGHVVLVVEDDEGIRSLVVYFLRDEQIRAEEARDGAEALGLVEAYRPLSPAFVSSSWTSCCHT